MEGLNNSNRSGLLGETGQAMGKKHKPGGTADSMLKLW